MSAKIVFEIKERAEQPGHIDVDCKAGMTLDATPREKSALANLQAILANAITENNRITVEGSYVVAKDGTKYERMPWETIEDTVQRMRKDYTREGERR